MHQASDAIIGENGFFWHKFKILCISVYNGLSKRTTLVSSYSTWACSMLSTKTPLTRMMRSPSLRPASSAAPPMSRLRIRWPSSSLSTRRKKPNVWPSRLVSAITRGLMPAISSASHQTAKRYNNNHNTDSYCFVYPVRSGVIMQHF